MNIRKKMGQLVEWALGYDHEVIVRLEDGARLPTRKYDGDLGWDLYASGDVGIQSGSTAEVPSGLFISPKDHIGFEIRARSSTLKVKGLNVVDAVIDRDYRGELMAIVQNPTSMHRTIKMGERVVQVLPRRIIPVVFVRGELLGSARGTSGWGSSGT